MAIPTLQYMKLVDGTDTSDAGSTYTTDDAASNTQNKIKVGDTIVVSGSNNNDGIFTVAGITINGTDVYYMLSGRLIVDETSGGQSVTITAFRSGSGTISNVGDRMIALGNVDTTNTTNAPAIDVWAYNGISDASSENDSWTQDAITPTFKGNDARYIFHFADNALRVCDTNGNNTSMIKWYGWVERNQFGFDESTSFLGWEQHTNYLTPPRIGSGGYSLGTYLTSHVTTVANNYHNNNRGVRYVLKTANGDVQLKDAVGDGTSTAFNFEDSSGDVDDQIVIGQIYTIDTSISSAYTEILLAVKPAIEAGDSTFVRAYGNVGPDTSYSADETPVIQRGTAWNVAVTEDTSVGEWLKKDWEFWETFIYDDNQESLPVQVSDGAATTDLAAGVTSSFAGSFALKVSVYADLIYSGRISGGRIYIREKASEDPMALLADIDIVKGIRLSFADEYTNWTLNSSNTPGMYVANLITKSQNLDTYETINGFSPKVDFVGIGRMNESYQCSTVSNRRTFIGNIKIMNKNGEIIKHGDRIMYSEVNKFDTITSNNFIDVSKGDYGEYTALESYADRLLAFKHNMVQIINIAQPSPTGWFLEETVRYMGVNYPYSVTKTERGIAWVNESGCFFYDGSRITNLLTGKIGVKETAQSVVESWGNFIYGSAFVKDPMIGYDPSSNQLIIMRSPNDGTTNSHLTFIYDFDSKGWIYNTTMFADSSYYTNFAHDWDNSLIVGKKLDSNSIEFKRYSAISFSQGGQQLITRDIDFGQPSVIKKIYKVYVTYKSTVAQTTPLEYSIDGTSVFTNFTGNLAATFSGGSALNDDSDIDADDTAIVVDDGTLYGVGDIVLIGSEQMFVNAVSSNTLTCSRGHNGTTADAHSDDAGITILKWDVGTLTLSSPVSCQSVQLRLNPASSGSLEINDMTIEYRVIQKRVS